MYINFTIPERILAGLSKSFGNDFSQNRIIKIFVLCMLLFPGFTYGQSGSVVLAWSPNTESNVSHYNLYRDTNSGTMVFLSSINHPDTTFVDNAVLENVTYYYKLTAVTTEGLESAPSNELEVLIGPPAITEEPNSTTVSEPDSAVFAVSASGMGQIHYQWRRDGVNISGATTDKYVLQPTSFAQDNGAQFDVTISNSQGSVTSNPAVLTVLESSNGNLISSEDFESGWGIWNDGGVDCNRIQKNASSGQYSVRLRDNTSSSILTSNSLDLTPYAEFEIRFSYLCSDMDNSNEDFWLQISTDGGSSYVTIEEWNLGDEFVNDKQYSDSVLVSGNGLTTTTRIRFRCDASAKNDYVYIDDIRIIGYTSPQVPNGNSNQGPPIDITTIKPNSEQAYSYQLFQNYPNPFNPTSTIPFDLAKESTVSLQIYNITGQLVRTLISDILSEGSFHYEWDAKDDFGNKVTSGVYLYRIKVADFVETRRMILLK